MFIQVKFSGFQYANSKIFESMGVHWPRKVTHSFKNLADILCMIKGLDNVFILLSADFTDLYNNAKKLKTLDISWLLLVTDNVHELIWQNSAAQNKI